MAALFITAPNWKQLKCVEVCPGQLEVLNPSAGEWTNKLWYTYAMECYFLKKEQIAYKCDLSLEECCGRILKRVRQKKLVKKKVHTVLSPFI